MLFAVGNIPCLKHVDRHLHDNIKNELNVHDFATGWQEVNQSYVNDFPSECFIWMYTSTACLMMMSVTKIIGH